MTGKAALLRTATTLEAWLFDLDGVLTDTASVHDSAWKETFDELLARRAGGLVFTPFDPAADYEEFVERQTSSRWCAVIPVFTGHPSTRG